MNGKYLSLSTYVSGYADYCTDVVTTKSSAATFVVDSSVSHLLENNGNTGYITTIYTPLGSSPLVLWSNPSATASYSSYYALCYLGSNSIISCTNQNGASYVPIMQLSSYNLYWAPAANSIPSGYSLLTLSADYI